MFGLFPIELGAKNPRLVFTDEARIRLLFF